MFIISCFKHNFISMYNITSISDFHQNITEITDYYDRTTQHDWIIPVSINIVLLCCTSFLLISIVDHGIKTKKWLQIQMSDSDKLNAGLVYSSLILCAIMCLLHYIASLAYLNLGFSLAEAELCDSISDVEHCFYVLALFQVELFMWFRQRAFYSNQMFQVHFSKTIRCISFLSIFVISTFSLVALIFVVLPNDHVANNGCKFTPEKNAGNDFLRTYVISSIFMAVIGQSVLVGLLLFALRQTNKRMVDKVKPISSNCTACCLTNCTRGEQNVVKETTPAVSEAPDTIPSLNFERSKSFRSSQSMVKRIMKKTLTFSIVSITADILVAIMTFCITNPKEHRELVIAMEDINAFFNLLFILFSFVQWKEIVLSPFTSGKKEDVNKSINAHQSVTDLTKQPIGLIMSS